MDGHIVEVANSISQSIGWYSLLLDRFGRPSKADKCIRRCEGVTSRWYGLVAIYTGQWRVTTGKTSAVSDCILLMLQNFDNKVHINKLFLIDYYLAILFP